MESRAAAAGKAGARKPPEEEDDGERWSRNMVTAVITPHTCSCDGSADVAGKWDGRARQSM